MTRSLTAAWACSACIHGAVFISGGIFFTKQAEFAVHEGRSSLEVLLEQEDTSYDPLPVIKEPEPVDDPVLPEDIVVDRKVKEPIQQTDQKPLTAVSKGAVLVNAKDHLNNPPPIYPDAARRLRQQGVVLLDVHVDRHGHPDKVNIRISSGFALLDRSAVKAVSRWIFAAARMGDIPVASIVEVPIRFKLDKL